MFRSLLFLSLLLIQVGWYGIELVTAGSSSNSMVDKATGIGFPLKKNGLEIFGVGVRKKGPIKIYSVACYGNKTVKESLSSISRSKNEKLAYKAFQNAILESPNKTSFVLEMAFKVGAAKMASAIAESVSPRHNGDKEDVEKLKEMIFQGVSNSGGAAIKGTTFQFDCENHSGMDIAVNGKHVGTIASPKLSSAFCNVYCDDECVSPALRKSCIEHCCAE